VAGASRHSRAAGAARAVVFDMDGLLVDTEPTWRAVHMEVFGELGLDLSRWPNIVTTGMRVDEVVAMRRTYYDWGEPDDAAVAARITSLVAERVSSTAAMCEGAFEAIAWCRERDLAVGLATGSRWPVIDAVLSSFGLESAFDACVSAGDLPYGKPHPAVYLEAATKLGAAATSCLAFEDAINGLVSAAAARMRTVIVPAGTSVGDPRVVLADVQLETLLQIDDGRVALLAGLSEAD
jgi:mannitol-1-/sugar-/sorbitol-6-/2-deoxyglucose-6-phosphatase